MTSCPCPSVSEAPSCTPKVSDYTDYPIVMFFGDRVSPNGDLAVFKTLGNEDFMINEYSLQPLIDAGIVSKEHSTLFYLTEKELLSTGSYSGWLTYCRNQIDCGAPNIKTLGEIVWRDLGINMEKLLATKLKIFLSISNRGDNSSIASAADFFDGLFDDPLTVEQQHLILYKIQLTYEWLKEIYDTYYGKQFLVKIGEAGSSAGTVPFHGVCVKDKDGVSPTTLPYKIEGTGHIQGLYTSDNISTVGGFPKINKSEVLGLSLDKEIEFVQLDDGRIDSFIKFGEIVDADGNPTVINKFGEEWVVDLSGMDPSSIYIRKNSENGYIHTLYIQATVTEKIYVTEEGQWAHIVVKDSLVPLRLKTKENSLLQALSYFLVLMDRVTSIAYQKDIKQEPGSDPNKPSMGASGNRQQYNLLTMQKMTAMPAGAVIPMKNNTFSYGPYYHSANSTGGTDISREEMLCPWNFIDTDFTNTQSAYDTMNCNGLALARDGARGLQQLEKGRITVASLPAYGLGYGVGNQDDSPTLLSDISVDFGSGGVTTTYNFETYSPRFGTPAKHILDSWSDSVKRIQHTNRYLKTDRLKADAVINNIFIKTIDLYHKKMGEGRQAPGDINKYQNTPKRLLISGYYFTPKETWDENQVLDPPNMDEGQPEETSGPLKITPCFPCSNSMSSPSPSNISSPTPNGENKYRWYTFSETHEAYQNEYVQKQYKQLSVMSLDGLFLPVSLRGSEPDLSEFPVTQCPIPRFAKRIKDDGSYAEWDDDQSSPESPGSPNPSKTRDELPPFKFKEQYVNLLPINQKYLNGITSEKSLIEWDERTAGSDQGFVVSSIAFGDKFEDYQVTHTNQDEEIRQGKENFRFSAIRGPLIVQGWGYDTTGKPIPNAADSPRGTELGEFRKVGLKDKFMVNWLANPKTWPVGPVDLRFDRERGVWTCPSPNKIVVARLKEDLLPGKSADAELINPQAGNIRFYDKYNISGPNGENIKASMKDTVIEVYDFLGVKLCKCDIIYAYYDDNRYIVLESSRAYPKPEDTICDCTTTTVFVTASRATPTITPTITPTTSPSPSPSASPSPSPSESPSPSASETPSPSESPRPSPSTPIVTQPCFCGLECLQTLQGYDSCKTQALIHKNGCLQWEDIVQCDSAEREKERNKEHMCQLERGDYDNDPNNPPPWW